MGPDLMKILAQVLIIEGVRVYAGPTYWHSSAEGAPRCEYHEFQECTAQGAQWAGVNYLLDHGIG